VTLGVTVSVLGWVRLNSFRTMNRRMFLAQAALGAFVGVACLFGRAERKAAAGRGDAAFPPEPWKERGEDALSRWRAAVRRPVVEGEGAELRRLAEAVRRGRRVRFCYWGGNESGERREIAPGMLYTVDGFEGVYLSGYCHTRGAERTFLVARMQGIEVSAG